MPFLQEVSVEILLVVFCINGMIYVGITLTDTPLRTPFDTAMIVTNSTIPSGLDRSNPHSLIQNETENVGNSTSTNSIILFLQGNLLTFFQYAYTFVLFITGGFIWTFLESLGMPSAFIYILESVMVFFLARTILYYITGK